MKKTLNYNFLKKPEKGYEKFRKFKTSKGRISMSINFYLFHIDIYFEIVKK